MLLSIAAFYGVRRFARRQEWKELDRKVDQASDDSFPASDPPASMTVA
jgi:hypothetical protein